MKTLNDYLNLSKQTNFSTGSSHPDVLEPILISFSCDDSKIIGMSLVDREKEGTLSNFSEASYASGVSTEDIANAINFSIQMYLREKKMSPREALRKRIQYLVNYLKSKDKEVLIQERDILLEYIKELLMSNIVKYMKTLSPDEEDSSGSANLMIALGISQYVTDKKLIMELQRSLKRLSPQLIKDGYMRRDLQVKVTKAYAPLFKNIIQTIEQKYVPESKWGILLPETK